MFDGWPRLCRACRRSIDDPAGAIYHVQAQHHELWAALMAALVTSCVLTDPAIETMTLGELWDRENQRAAP